VDVIEGEPAIVNVTARANPSEVSYKWFRDGTAIKQLKEANAYDRVTFDGSLLNLTTVRRDDKGEYKCEATNSEGARSHIVRLNVQCNQPTKSFIIRFISLNIFVLLIDDDRSRFNRSNQIYCDGQRRQ
jgi:hypothetical protein